MAENPEPVVNGLDDLPPIKSEPVDPLLDADTPIIPKEFSATNGIHEDSDCEDISYFTQIEVDNTRKCLENTRLIIKDFETQLDWHLQQYMTLRNIFNPKKNSKNSKDDASKRQDLLSISQLSAIIANHPEGNKKFIKRKGPISNGAGGRKRRRTKDSESEEEETDFSDEDSEDYDEEDFDEGNESEDVDDPDEPKGKPKKKTRGRKGKNADDDPLVVPKDEIEIEEENYELIEPKEEKESDDEEDEMEEPPSPKKTPPKRGRKPKAAQPEEAKSPAKRGPKGGKRGQKNMETVDLTNLKTCKVVLNRLQDDSQDSIVEIKDEDIDRDELMDLLQTKAIEALEDFVVDAEKPIVILKNDNLKDFDFNECKTSNVVITFEDSEDFPEFVFIKNVANQILNGSIKLVQAGVFDEHSEQQK